MTQIGLRGLGKEFLGRIPYAPGLYQGLIARDRVPSAGYRLDRLADYLPGWILAAKSTREDRRSPSGRRILILASLQWWLEHAISLALVLLARGHEVDLAYLPYRRWSEVVSVFDQVRQSTYMKRSLSALSDLVGLYDLTQLPPAAIDQPLLELIEEQSLLDVQYTQQREMVDLETDRYSGELFNLRLSRNRAAAAALSSLLRSQSYDVALIPNGSILEFGAGYRTARALRVPTVTYEFGEQRQRIWLARNQEVMRLPTDGLWAARGEVPLALDEKAEIENLYQARRGGQEWNTFARRWQQVESAGASSARRGLGLDPSRPVALLCTNVVGDSLALDRQIFTSGMADWLERTVQYFAARPETQLVVRVHPGELLGAGHPSIEIIRNSLPNLPPAIKVIAPDSPVNTYDLIELAHLGLTYTTTVGMEMAMFGIPVVVAGETHYRGRGFSDDPVSLDEYFSTISARLDEPLGRTLSPSQVNRAWRYAHRFFFEFPFAFPWHLVSFWDDVEQRPLAKVVSALSGRYDSAMSVLSGEPIDWDAKVERQVEEQPA